MARILGVRAAKGVSKKTGKAFDAVYVSYTQPYKASSGGLGLECAQQYIDRQLFDSIVGDLQLHELIGLDIKFVFNSNGFLDEFELYEPSAPDKPGKG